MYTCVGQMLLMYTCVGQMLFMYTCVGQMLFNVAVTRTAVCIPDVEVYVTIALRLVVDAGNENCRSTSLIFRPSWHPDLDFLLKSTFLCILSISAGIVLSLYCVVETNF
jgi:hypothetical protein